MQAPQGAGRFLGWLAATTVSAIAGWAALQPVLTTAVPDRVDVLSGPELRSGSSSNRPTPDSPGVSIATSPVSPTDVASPATPDADRTDDETAPPVPPDPDPPRDDEPDDASTPNVVEDGWTVTDASDGSKVYTRTFEVEGGTARIRIADGAVDMLSGDPNPPYEMEVQDEDPARLIVNFHTAAHLYVIDAMWWEGRPYAQVSEVQ